eukprot:3929328-Pyramimonas_sp.AAC.3
MADIIHDFPMFLTRCNSNCLHGRDAHPIAIVCTYSSTDRRNWLEIVPAACARGLPPPGVEGRGKFCFADSIVPEVGREG